MIVSRSSILYFFYSLLISISFFLSVNIISPEIKWILNKIFYIISIILIFLIFFNEKIKKEVVFILLFSYSFVSMLVYFYHYDLPQALANIASKSFLYFIVFIITYYFVNNFSLNLIIRPFFIAGFVFLAISLLIYLGLDLNFYLEDSDLVDAYLSNKESIDLMGFSGVFLNQNSMAILCLVSLISSLFLYFLEVNTYKKLVYVSILLSIVMLFMTVSRAGILAAIVILMLMFIRKYNNRKFILSYAFLSILLIILFIILFDLFMLLVDRVQNDGTSIRSEIWMDALEVFKGNYLMGVGDYRYVISKGELSAHNVYIQNLASYGLVGSFLWFIFLSIFLYYAIFKLFFKKKLNSIYIFSCASFIAILIHQIFEANISNIFAPITLLMFVLMCIVKKA